MVISKDQKQSKEFVKVCPQCGSTDITIPPAGLDIRMSIPDYCQECQNRGIFPKVQKDKVEDFKKRLK